MIPTVEQLRSAFTCLDRLQFPKTQRLPLVAARQWRASWERAAWSRFRDGLSNVHEVAWPKFYLAREEPAVRRLFLSLTLGRVDSDLGKRPELSCLYDGGPRPGVPQWTVIHRFGRYILRSHPASEGEDWIYFGDDTLFLMNRCRQLSAQIPHPLRCLDLCCGGGGVGLALDPFEGTLQGVDLNAVAVKLAENTAAAQGLDSYSYHCDDALQKLDGTFDLIFGNPPTLSPALTGRDVLHATGSEDVLPVLLEKVLRALTPAGRAIFTFFSECAQGRDSQWERLKELLRDQRGYHCYARREYPLGGDRFLRHSALELGPAGQSEQVFEPLRSRGVQLPAVKRRQL